MSQDQVNYSLIDNESHSDAGSSSNISIGFVKDALHGYRRIITTCWVYIMTSLNLLFLGIAVVAFLLVTQNNSRNLYKTNKNLILKETSYFSPIFDRFEINTSNVQVDGNLRGRNPPSIYRGNPGPEVDDAWNRISRSTAVPITAEEVRKLGKDPKIAVKFPDDWGFGKDAYVAQVDVFHQIHCLNAIRMEMHTEYEGYQSRPRNAFRQAHLSHCLHLLLQNILCEASVDIITYNWLNGSDFPFPDFGVVRQCRDFEQILEWQTENEVKALLYTTITPPEGVVPIRPPKELIYDFTKPGKGILKPT